MSTHIAEHDSNSTLDTLAAELGAMQIIAKALSDVRDRDARQRVLSWAQERFTELPPAPLPVCVATPKPAQDDDDTLSVEGLQEFFEQPRGVAELMALQTLPNFAESSHGASADDGREPGLLGMLVRGVANRLKVLAAEWQTV
jgi:hypothetical protein